MEGAGEIKRILTLVKAGGLNQAGAEDAKSGGKSKGKFAGRKPTKCTFYILALDGTEIYKKSGPSLDWGLLAVIPTVGSDEEPVKEVKKPKSKGGRAKVVEDDPPTDPILPNEFTRFFYVSLGLTECEIVPVDNFVYIFERDYTPQPPKK